MLERRTERGGPSAEPEIILPDRSVRRSGDGRYRIQISVAGRSGGRTYLAKPGPVTAIVAGIVLGMLVLATLVIVLGVFLIWIPGRSGCRRPYHLQPAARLLPRASIAAPAQSGSYSLVASASLVVAYSAGWIRSRHYQPVI